MKKFCFRNIVATALAVAMSVSISIPTFAAEVAPEDDIIQQSVTTARIIPEDGNKNTSSDNVLSARETIRMIASQTSSYTRIIYLPNGLPGNFSIIIPGFDNNRYRGDIMMYGPNGLVWQEQDCMEGRDNRTFLCGSGVTSVWFRIVSRGDYSATFYPQITY